MNISAVLFVRARTSHHASSVLTHIPHDTSPRIIPPPLPVLPPFIVGAREHIIRHSCAPQFRYRYSCFHIKISFAAYHDYHRYPGRISFIFLMHPQTRGPKLLYLFHLHHASSVPMHPTNTQNCMLSQNIVVLCPFHLHCARSVPIHPTFGCGTYF